MSTRPLVHKCSLWIQLFLYGMPFHFIAAHRNAFRSGTRMKGENKWPKTEFPSVSNALSLVISIIKLRNEAKISPKWMKRSTERISQGAKSWKSFPVLDCYQFVFKPSNYRFFSIHSELMRCNSNSFDGNDSKGFWYFSLHPQRSMEILNEIGDILET